MIIMSKSSEKTTAFTEGQTNLMHYLINSCATFLEVEAPKKKEKTTTEITIDLIRGVEEKLRENYLNAMMGEDEVSKLKEKIQQLEEQLKVANVKK